MASTGSTAASLLRLLAGWRILRRLGRTLAEEMSGRLRSALEAWRAEVRRACTALAMTFVATICGLAAIGFAIAATLLAAGPEHRVLMCSLIALALALLAALAWLTMRRQTAAPRILDRD